MNPYKRHEELVEKIGEKYENWLDNSEWDQVYTSVHYGPSINWRTEPPSYPENAKDAVGEFDILLIDENTATIGYLELKTKEKDLRYGANQLREAKKYFEDKGFNFFGGTLLINNFQEAEKLLDPDKEIKEPLQFPDKP